MFKVLLHSLSRIRIIVFELYSSQLTLTEFYCSMKFDKYAIIYCEKEPFTYFENYLAIVKFDNFLKAKDKLVKAAKTMQPDDIIPFSRQFGNYLNYVDGSTDLFTEVEIYGATQDFKVRPFLPSAKFEQMNF